jgi:diguanylate cyclase (GGDEF)-like protein
MGDQMISISKYWKQRSPDENGALRRALGLMLQSLEIHTVEGDEIDYAQFRSGMQVITSTFADDTPPDEVLIMVGKVATAFREYGERTTRYRKAQTAEYRRMLAMLTDTITATSHASDRTVGRLQQIEKKLERAAVIEDVRVLRMQLDECLESIRQEIRRQETESKSQDLPLDPGVSPLLAPPLEATDAATGLQGRAAAERALEEQRTRAGQCYAVAVVANRLASINSRFGYAVGDRLLRKLSDGTRSGLSMDDRLFRWGGPCLVALLLRTTPEHELRAELQRITSAFKEELVEIGNRAVLLPISAAWAVFPLNEPSRVIRQKIDQFVASQSADY